MRWIDARPLIALLPLLSLACATGRAGAPAEPLARGVDPTPFACGDKPVTADLMVGGELTLVVEAPSAGGQIVASWKASAWHNVDEKVGSPLGLTRGELINFEAGQRTHTWQMPGRQHELTWNGPKEFTLSAQVPAGSTCRLVGLLALQKPAAP